MVRSDPSPIMCVCAMSDRTSVSLESELVCSTALCNDQKQCLIFAWSTYTLVVTSRRLDGVLPHVSAASAA